MKSIKKYSLKFKLSLSYALVALMMMASVSLFANFFLRKQFENYIINQQSSKNEQIVAQIGQEYDNDTDTFDMNSLETIGVDALGRGMIVKVSDASGKVLWDAMVHNNGLCHQMLQEMADSMQARYRNFHGAYEEEVYPVMVNAEVVGSVSVGTYGPFYFSEEDAVFIDTLNRALFILGAASLALALLIGMLMARRISRPITETINAAEKIARGEYHHKIAENSSTQELDKLVESINRLSAELKSQDQLRKRLTADIAHELRTPLSALQGNIEAFIDGIWQPDRAHLQSCDEEILRLTRLVSDLERLAQLERENPILKKTEFDIKEMAQKVALSFGSDCLAKKIDLTVSGEEATLIADQDKIRQVFINLISNSIKYTPEGGKIDVRVTNVDKTVRVEVEDNGIGIAKEHLPYVFERFYRVDPSRSSGSGGSGIGLAIVKAIVEMHDGQIKLASSPGRGSLFTVELPGSINK